MQNSDVKGVNLVRETQISDTSQILPKPFCLQASLSLQRVYIIIYFYCYYV